MICLFLHSQPIKSENFSKLARDEKLLLTIKPTIIGLESAKQSMSYSTVIKLNNFKSNSFELSNFTNFSIHNALIKGMVNDFLDCLTSIHELDSYKSKMNERKILNNLNRGITFKIKGAVKTPALKIKVLLQAHLMNMNISHWEMRNQINDAVRILIRVLRLAKKILIESNCFTVLLITLILERSLANGFWIYDHLLEFKQLHSIGNKIAKNLILLGFGSLKKLDLSSFEMFKLQLKKAKLSNSQVYQIFNEFQCVPRLTIEPIAKKNKQNNFLFRFLKKCSHNMHNRFNVLMYSQKSKGLVATFISNDREIKNHFLEEDSSDLVIACIHTCYPSSDIFYTVGNESENKEIKGSAIQKTEKKVFGVNKAQKTNFSQKFGLDLHKKNKKIKHFSLLADKTQNPKKTPKSSTQASSTTSQKKKPISTKSQINPLGFISIINKKRKQLNNL